MKVMMTTITISTTSSRCLGGRYQRKNGCSLTLLLRLYNDNEHCHSWQNKTSLLEIKNCLNPVAMTQQAQAVEASPLEKTLVGSTLPRHLPPHWIRHRERTWHAEARAHDSFQLNNSPLNAGTNGRWPTAMDRCCLWFPFGWMMMIIMIFLRQFFDTRQKFAACS